MAQIRIFLSKNDLSKNPKLPYFTLTLPPAEDGGEWTDIGALWKAKSGNGYSGALLDGITIDTSKIKKFEKKVKAAAPEEEEEIPLPPDPQD